MARINKRIAFSVPPDLLAEFEELAREERCTKSELFRRVFRTYQKRRDEKKLEQMLLDGLVSGTRTIAPEDWQAIKSKILASVKK